MERGGLRDGIVFWRGRHFCFRVGCQLVFSLAASFFLLLPLSLLPSLSPLVLSRLSEEAPASTMLCLFGVCSIPHVLLPCFASWGLH